MERFIIDEGHVAHRVHSDYGYDLFMQTFDEDGFLEPNLVQLQLKASETLTLVDDAYVFDLDIRDYNVWMDEEHPIVLILFESSRRKAFWLFVQQYFHDQPERRPLAGARTIRVRVPQRQTITRRAIAKMRALKHEFVLKYLQSRR